RLDVDLARIDDLVLVGGRALDRSALRLLDLAQLEVDLRAERADLDGLGLGLIADAAHFDLVDALRDAVLRRLELAFFVYRLRRRSLLDRGLGVDHVDDRALRAVVRDRLLAGVDELNRAADRSATTGQAQKGDQGQRSYCHGLFSLERPEQVT